MMDYKQLLQNELRRNDYKEPEVYENELQDLDDDVFPGPEYLLTNVPTEDQVIAAIKCLMYDNPDRKVMLIPVLPFLQSKLMITSQRLNEVIRDNDWIFSWLDHIRSLQEVRILEMFSAGNMEDSKLKWLIWSILGEPVDLSISRASVSNSAKTTLFNDNKYGSDS